MDESTRAASLLNLQKTRDALQTAVAGLSETQARFKPSLDLWSIEEIVEHLAVSEHGMYRFISDLHTVSDDPHELESAATLARTADRKKMPLPAPERVVPKRRYENLDAALHQFLENRERTIAYIQSCPDDLRQRIIQHPAGMVNAQDCLTILIHHPARHVQQINELKADPAFPR